MSDKLMVFGSDRKRVEFRCSVVKGQVWKESGVTTQEWRKVEVGIRLLNNDKKCYYRKWIKLFLVFKVQVRSIGRTFHD